MVFAPTAKGSRAGNFTVDGGTTPVVVQMQPTPLPLSTIRIEVFNDYPGLQTEADDAVVTAGRQGRQRRVAAGVREGAQCLGLGRDVAFEGSQAHRL